jgi:hypothetical protein
MIEPAQKHSHHKYGHKTASELKTVVSCFREHGTYKTGSVTFIAGLSLVQSWENANPVVCITDSQPPLGSSTPHITLSSHSQSQSYFTTGGLPPISLSRCHAPSDLRPEIFFNRTLAVIFLM